MYIVLLLRGTSRRARSAKKIDQALDSLAGAKKELEQELAKGRPSVSMSGPAVPRSAPASYWYPPAAPVVAQAESQKSEPYVTRINDLITQAGGELQDAQGFYAFNKRSARPYFAAVLDKLEEAVGEWKKLKQAAPQDERVAILLEDLNQAATTAKKEFGNIGSADQDLVKRADEISSYKGN